MKKLLLHAFAILTALLPLQIAEAAPKPPPVFGGWSPGKTFTFRVTSASSYAAQIGGNVPVAVPKGLPVFTLGQEVTFTIGKKGELIATKVKVPFGADGGTANSYNNKSPKKGNAVVFKSLTTGEALSASLNYVVPTKAGVVWVTYLFNP
jgi:hypothetical protein